jgi:hypothetical protein
VNSEELELSLKTEFESYLNELFAGMRENTAELQKNFEAEFEKHRAQLDEATRLFAERFENSPKLDVAFAQSVTEHLRLAKDSGAELAAMAFSEAEKLNAETPASVSYESIRDAINEISSKTSQSTILSSLVEHAATFAPRGVFFIVKNENFVGWKRFGHDRNSPEEVANVSFEAGGETVLDRAVKELKTSDSSYSEGGPDRVFIDSLDLGRPDRMYAIPLIARGRGVAVMYADYGIGGTNLNIEALETLVRVAGITVELLAASQTANVQAQPATTKPSYEPAPEAVAAAREPEYDYHTAEEHVVAEPSVQTETDFFVSKTFNAAEMAAYIPETVDREVEPEVASSLEVAVETAYDAPVEFEYETADVAAAELEQREQHVYQPVEVETFATAEMDSSELTETIEVEAETFEVEEEPVSTVSDFAFSTNSSFDPSPAYPEAVEAVAEPSFAEPEVVTNGFHVETASTPVVEMPASQPQVRFSERNMDLPIEVPDEERRLHNDARRFARLLVSEIKLYNEQKVTEGRESGDLYDRLREAIDRSRDMYEKRVQPTVASKFDYFHYELVNNLAEGQEEKLGNSYVATAV